MKNVPRRVLAITFVVTLAAPRVEALRFRDVDAALLPAGVRSALWVRDCGRPGFADKDCAEEEKRFSKGDSIKLAALLGGGRKYDEVWLASNGGVLDEGLSVGAVLRRFQATVRVPPRQACVSSCTVAFLGGVFRYIDLEQGATYEVHAGSSFLGESWDSKVLARVMNDPEGELRKRSVDEASDSRDLAQQLFTHFQKAVHPLGQLPPGVESSNRVVFLRLPIPPPNPYLTGSQIEDDARIIRREGASAAQDILMRIERDSMQHAVDELRTLLPSLGPRAEAALRILETMYSSRILGTASLSYETLLRMGFVTKVFNPQK